MRSRGRTTCDLLLDSLPLKLTHDTAAWLAFDLNVACRHHRGAANVSQPTCQRSCRGGFWGYEKSDWLLNGATDCNLLLNAPLPPPSPPITSSLVCLFIYAYDCCSRRNQLSFCVVTATLTKLGSGKVYSCHMHTFLQFCFHRNAESFCRLGVWELRKPLTVIRDTHRGGYFFIWLDLYF